MSCESCVFFFPMKDEEFGLCRRYPPILRGDNEYRFPVIGTHGWCGEFLEAGYTVTPAGRAMLKDGE